MFNIEDSKAINDPDPVHGDDLSAPLILEEGGKGPTQTKESGCWMCCCCKKKKSKTEQRRPKRKKRRRRRNWSETIGGIRLICKCMAILMLAAALYLDNIIIAAPYILMNNPNSPDDEDLRVPVEQFSVRRDEIQLQVPVSGTTSSVGYLEYTVKYSTCENYDRQCSMLLRDGKIFFLASIIGIAIAFPGALLQFTRSSRRKIMKLLSFLAMVDILVLLGFWWLEVYLTLINTKTANYPFYSKETTETTLIEMTFENVVIYPGYSLALVSLSGLTLCSDFAFSLCF